MEWDAALITAILTAVGAYLFVYGGAEEIIDAAEEIEEEGEEE